MAKQRRLNALKMEPNPFPMWRQKPDKGIEQIELERMLKAREIDPKATPDSVRQSNEMFKKFSPTVFASHFRTTKASLGLCAVVNAGTSSSTPTIPELGGSLNCSQRESDSPLPSECFIDRPPIDFINAPFWTWIYRDHEKKLDFVCVAVVILSGSKGVKFVLSEDGTQITIMYQWPRAIFVAAELFHNAKIGNLRISAQHPKVHSFVSHLLENGVTENSTPRGEIIIQLPQKVQRSTTGYKQETIKMNDTNICLLEFSAYQNALLVDDVDTSFNF